ncbi:MAG: hypothetical protein JNM36_05540 [Chitinophagales bacterium]|jgi:hypothetical protein|nr:hypothetical protein [Chitinophagales bacterium]HNI44426.1 hypothetical protein [Chitinophagales bacterium]
MFNSNQFLSKINTTNGIDDVENTLTQLKSLGASPMQCVLVLCKVLKISIQEADSLVVESTTWQEIKTDVDLIRREWTNFLDSSD